MRTRQFLSCQMRNVVMLIAVIVVVVDALSIEVQSLFGIADQ
jgi:hypothetical protein